MNHYETLGVSAKATPEEISQAYQTLTKKFKVFGEEPDSNKFKKLDKAYQVLSDATTRQAYDQYIGDPANFKKRKTLPKRINQQDTYDARNKVSIWVMLSILFGIFLAILFQTAYMLLLPVVVFIIGMVMLWNSNEVSQDPVDINGDDVASGIVEGIIDGLFD